MPSGDSSSSSSSSSSRDSSNSDSDDDSESDGGSNDAVKVFAAIDVNPLIEICHQAQFVTSRGPTRLNAGHSLNSSNTAEEDQIAGYYLRTITRDTNEEESPMGSETNDLHIFYNRRRPLFGSYLCDRIGLTLVQSSIYGSNNPDTALNLNSGCCIHPSAYEALWEMLAADVVISTGIVPVAGGTVGPVTLCAHLINAGFFVVAQQGGEGDNAARVFAFAAGKIPSSCQLEEDIEEDGGESFETEEEWCLCLLQINLASSDVGQWNLGCAIRCTQSRCASLFLQKLLLGDLYELTEGGSS